MLKELKKRILGEDRVIGAVADIKTLYETADDPEAFHAALQEGNFERAAEHHRLTAEELEDRFSELLRVGKDIEDDHGEILDYDKDELINA